MTLVCAMSLAACGNKNAKAETESKKAVQDATESTKKAEKTEKIALSDGTYTAEFTTDSSMFHAVSYTHLDVYKRQDYNKGLS